MPSIFQELLQLPDSAIFAIISVSDKKAYISYTSNLKARLGLIANEISSDTFKCKFNMENVEMRILETGVDKVFVKYYVDHYRNIGYTVFEERLPLQYTFKIEFSIGEAVIKVIAVNKGNDKIILGKFKFLEKAEEFLNYVNRNNISKNLIYSIDR